MKAYEVALFYDENMKQLKTNNLHAVGMDIPSIPFSNLWSGGEYGILPTFTGTNVEQRPITIRMYIDGVDLEDYSLLKSELYEVFDYGKPIYIIDKKQKGKRYKVVLDAGYLPERIIPVLGKVEIPFITCEIPYAESIATTALIDKNGLRFSDEVWSFGMGLLLDNESHSYTHQTTKFRIYNAGNVLIHPFELDLRIELSGIVGSGFEMKNVTTGDIFKVNDELKTNDIFIIDGAQMIYNDVINGFRKTNHGFITLAPGWNEFKLNKPAKTVFDFPFYYK